jgi:hypothetical protein
VTEDDNRVALHAMDTVQAPTEPTRRLVDAPLQYPLEAYRILSGLTRLANGLPQLLEFWRAASTGCAPVTA